MKTKCPLQKNDLPLLDSFLNAECRDYRWGAPKYRSEFKSRLRGDIMHYVKEAGPLNYVHLCSLTNMGLTNRRLSLTPTNWGPDTVLVLYMPPNPNGAIGVHTTPHRRETY